MFLLSFLDRDLLALASYKHARLVEINWLIPCPFKPCITFLAFAPLLRIIYSASRATLGLPRISRSHNDGHCHPPRSD